MPNQDLTRRQNPLAELLNAEPTASFSHPDSFARRHIGPSPESTVEMLKLLGYSSLDELINEAVPAQIRLPRPLQLPAARSEAETLAALKALASQNQVFRSYIGMGYYDCIVPAVIQRNLLENPGWYTQYTPYQAEIAQGRLEGLLTFQTLVTDLTALPIANASMLDEATAAAEAMAMCHAAKGSAERNRFIVAGDCHPQTIAVVRTRARPLGIEVAVAPRDAAVDELDAKAFGILLQYPATDGAVHDHRAAVERAHA